MTLIYPCMTSIYLVENGVDAVAPVADPTASGWRRKRAIALRMDADLQKGQRLDKWNFERSTGN